MNVKQKAVQLAKAIEPAVNVYLAARVVAELEREKCNAIQKKVLVSMGYDCEPSRAWNVLSDAEAARYYGYLDAAYAAAGYELEPGYCPALMAETAQTKAARALVDAAEPFMEVSADQVLCAGLDKYKKYIDLLVGLCVSAPGYKRVA